MKTRYTDASGVSVAYQVLNDGDLDIVLVPGMASHLELHWCEPEFAALMRSLASAGRLITFDKRGTGRSARVRSVPTLEQRLEDLVAVLDAAESERAVVFGVSEGAALACLFAATYPARARALVLCSSFPTGSRSGGYPGAVRPERLAQALDVWEHWGSGRSYEIYAPSLVGNRLHQYLLGVFERASASPPMMTALVESLFAIDIRHILPLVQVPTLMFHRVDEIAPIESARQMAQLIPDCELVELHGDDHVPYGVGGEVIVRRTQEFVAAIQSDKYDRAVGTVLFTDIVDSTRLASAMGDRSWLDLLDRHDQLVRSCVDEHGGRELKNLGDGFLVHFDGPVRAIRCATSIAGGVHELALDVRAGIHTGELQLTEREVRGLAVHVGARISASASAGEVRVSRAVKDLSVGSGIVFEPLEPVRLKGLEGQWQLFSVDRASVVPAPTSTVESYQEGLGLADRAMVAMSLVAPRLAGKLLALNRPGRGPAPQVPAAPVQHRSS